MIHRFIMLLLAAFLFSSPSFYSQNSCLDLEKRLDRAFETDLSAYFKLTQELKGCEVKEKVGEADSRYTYFLAKYFLKKGNFQKVKVLIQSNLKIQKNQSTCIDLKLLEAVTLMIENKYMSSIEKLNEILSKNTLSDFQHAKAYQYLGNIHAILGNRRYHFSALTKANHYAKKTKDRSYISNTLSNIAGFYFDRSDAKSNSKAAYLFKRALEINFKEDSATNGSHLNSLGALYVKLRNEKQALYYLTECYTKYKHFFDENQVYLLMSNLGAIYLIQGNYDHSTRYYKEALKSYNRLEEKSSYDISIFYDISELEYMKGNYRKSRDYLRTYFNLKRYYDAKERNDRIIQMQEKYFASEKKKQIVQLKLNNQRAKLSYYKLQNGVILSVVLLGLLVTLFLYRQRKKEQALKIERKNELKRATLEASENEKLRFSRDLHDTLGGSLTLISLLVNQAGDKNPDQVSDFNKLYDVVQGSITDLRRVCRDMYPSEILVSGVINSLRNFYLRLGTIHESFNFNFKADDLKLEKSFSVNLYRILQELTNNTLKYAEATMIDLNIQKDGAELRILFKDNGKGIDLNELQKGVGLNSIEERTKAYKGNVKFNSSSGNGFTAVMRFPFNEIVEKETV